MALWSAGEKAEPPEGDWQGPSLRPQCLGVAAGATSSSSRHNSEGGQLLSIAESLGDGVTWKKPRGQVQDHEHPTWNSSPRTMRAHASVSEPLAVWEQLT